MQRLEVSGAVRHIYIYIYIYVVRRQRVKLQIKYGVECSRLACDNAQCCWMLQSYRKNLLPPYILNMEEEGSPETRSTH
jgi:hypothetical protein